MTTLEYLLASSRRDASGEAWNPRDEFADATFGELARSAALTIDGRGCRAEHLCLHHHRDRRLNWPALATSMARVLIEPLPCTNEQRDVIYDHLSRHYGELGIEPPAPGLITDDHAYELALEGRIAHLDDDGDAWMFAEAVEHDGQVLPGFVSVESEARLKLCVRPRSGPYVDPAIWGNRQHVQASVNRNAYDELAFRTWEDNRNLGR